MSSDRNFSSGSDGLVAIDKLGNQVLFLDPNDYTVTRTLDGFAPRVHDLLISEDHARAFVPIYGDGIHGDNPHPGHLIAVIDLIQRRHAGDFSVSPYQTPHGIRWGSDGRLYCICENSGVVLEMNADTGVIQHVLEVGSNKGHRIEIMPDGSKLYVETEEDGFVSVIDLNSRRRLTKIALPGELDGLGISPDGKTLVAVDGRKPAFYVIDTERDQLIRSVVLEHHTKSGQIARYSPNGEFLVITSHEEPIATILTGDLASQKAVQLGKGPMDMAFHPDQKTVLIANEDEGTLMFVDLREGEAVKTIHAGVGIETLSFY